MFMDTSCTQSWRACSIRRACQSSPLTPAKPLRCSAVLVLHQRSLPGTTDLAAIDPICGFLSPLYQEWSLFTVTVVRTGFCSTRESSPSGQLPVDAPRSARRPVLSFLLIAYLLWLPLVSCSDLSEDSQEVLAGRDFHLSTIGTGTSSWGGDKPAIRGQRQRSQATNSLGPCLIVFSVALKPSWRRYPRPSQLSQGPSGSALQNPSSMP